MVNDFSGLFLSSLKCKVLKLKLSIKFEAQRSVIISNKKFLRCFFKAQTSSGSAVKFVCNYVHFA
ncbi:hypothetical protein FLL71_06625 [Vibrio cholerae]|nr:hypothetical protein FLL71_06625 [Vibrio cholerae]